MSRPRYNLVRGFFDTIDNVKAKIQLRSVGFLTPSTTSRPRYNLVEGGGGL
jgi:hypothetical protein